MYICIVHYVIHYVCVYVWYACVCVYKLKQKFLELMFILLLEYNLMFSILFHFYFLINLFLCLHWIFVAVPRLPLLTQVGATFCCHA